MLEYISQIYPLGISESDPQYFKSPKVKRILELSRKTSVEQNGIWARIIRTLRMEREALEVSDKSSDLHPCYSASLLLFRQKLETLTYERELRIYISVIAPFYTVLGYDIVTINQVQRTLDPLIFVSPISIYEKWFVPSRILIEKHFSDYRFIPFVFLEEQIEGLWAPIGSHEYPGDCVFQAFFTNENVSKFKTIGNQFYE